jgi:hypothetical protein
MSLLAIAFHEARVNNPVTAAAAAAPISSAVAASTGRSSFQLSEGYKAIGFKGFREELFSLVKFPIARVVKRSVAERQITSRSMS